MSNAMAPTISQLLQKWHQYKLSTKNRQLETDIYLDVATHLFHAMLTERTSRVECVLLDQQYQLPIAMVSLWSFCNLFFYADHLRFCLLTLIYLLRTYQIITISVEFVLFHRRHAKEVPVRGYETAHTTACKLCNKPVDRRNLTCRACTDGMNDFQLTFNAFQLRLQEDPNGPLSDLPARILFHECQRRAIQSYQNPPNSSDKIDSIQNYQTPCKKISDKSDAMQNHAIRPKPDFLICLPNNVKQEAQNKEQSLPDKSENNGQLNKEAPSKSSDNKQDIAKDNKDTISCEDTEKEKQKKLRNQLKKGRLREQKRLAEEQAREQKKLADEQKKLSDAAKVMLNNTTVKHTLPVIAPKVEANEAEPKKEKKEPKNETKKEPTKGTNLLVSADNLPTKKDPPQKKQTKPNTKKKTKKASAKKEKEPKLQPETNLVTANTKETKIEEPFILPFFRFFASRPKQEIYALYNIEKFVLQYCTTILTTCLTFCARAKPNLSENVIGSYVQIIQLPFAKVDFSSKTEFVDKILGNEKTSKVKQMILEIQATQFEDGIQTCLETKPMVTEIKHILSNDPQLKRFKSFFIFFDIYDVCLQHMKALLLHRKQVFRPTLLSDRMIDRIMLNHWIAMMNTNKYRLPWGAFTCPADTLEDIILVWWQDEHQTKNRDLYDILTRSGLTCVKQTCLSDAEEKRQDKSAKNDETKTIKKLLKGTKFQ